MPKYVYTFAEGNKDLNDLLGGKGANLAEMTNLGLPVPPGFTITTEACRAYLSAGTEPEGLREEIQAHLAALEDRMGRRLGDPEDPLLVSVRSGARFSMPGMMDTVLNVGLSDRSVAGLAARSGDERFAWDSYRRLVQMFGRTVLGVDGAQFEDHLAATRRARGVDQDVDLTAEDLREVVSAFRVIVRRHTGADFPQDAAEQLRLAVRAVFRSWNGERARLYRRQERIPDDLGTAVSIVAMVFGNQGPDSGTGVAFTRDPATGRPGVYGDYLPDAQGEDVVAGTRNTMPLADLENHDPRSYARLLDIMRTLESHYRDLCDIEFTIERGTLWMLQTRVGKRTAAAAFRIATQLLDEGVIGADEALERVTGEQLAQLMFPRFDTAHAPEPLVRGIPASPGAAVGEVVFDSVTAQRRAAEGRSVILVRRETNPDDLAGMVAAAGILTGRGGKTSHAAVVARGMGRTCVCGAEELDIDPDHRKMTGPGGVLVAEGDTVSVDGTTGAVHLGAVPVVPSSVVEYFEGRLRPEDAEDDLVRAVDRLMRHADARRRLDVRANADNPEDAARARRFGASGIGLCRTEHMFLGERRRYVERLVLAESDADRGAALAALEPLQRGDFAEILEAMDGLVVTVRLIDPPLHEFLPDLTELSVRVALDRARAQVGGAGAGAADAADGAGAIGEGAGAVPEMGESTGTRAGAGRGGDGAGDADAPPGTSTPGTGDGARAVRTADGGDERLLREVRRMHEQNPMLGLRGVRLGLVVPGLFAMQIRALARAVADRVRAGGDPRAEIMVPLVGGAREFELVRAEADRVLAEVRAETGVDIRLAVGTMIELPRAALTAGPIAASAEFFSFGTNDLTQTTWGFSRDDVEASFFADYLDLGVFAVSPFETLDREGVGRLVRIAVEEGRAARPDLVLGVCGEHGGDPDSVHFFHETGLDYVSCSPFRVPVARLEAGRAAVTAGGGTDMADSR